MILKIAFLVFMKLPLSERTLYIFVLDASMYESCIDSQHRTCNNNSNGDFNGSTVLIILESLSILVPCQSLLCFLL